MHKPDDQSSVATNTATNTPATSTTITSDDATPNTPDMQEKVLVRPDEEHQGQFVITYIARRPTAQEYFDFLNKTDEPTKKLFVQIAELGSLEKTVEFLKFDLNSEIGLSWSNESELAILADKYNSSK